MSERKPGIPMRIAVWSHSFLPAVGGVELYTDQLARQLAAKGIDVTVVTRTAALDGSDGDRPYRALRGASRREVGALLAASDSLHSNGFNLGVFREARRRRVPILWFHHDYDVICPKSIAWNAGASCGFSLAHCVPCLARDHSPTLVARRLAAFAIKRSWLRSVRMHAVLTNYARERMRLHDAVVVHSAPNLTIAEKPLTRPLLSRGEAGGDPRRLLFVGRLIPEKGCEVLLQAVARCRDAAVSVGLDVCGDGVERARLERVARDLGVGDAVRFVGTLPPEEVVGLMRSALATVVPSIWDEVTGAVALEAMACGCPVVAAEVGGLGEVVRNVGMLFPRGDVAALTELVIALVRDRGLSSSLSERSCKAHSRVYNWSSVVNEYLDLYQGMLAKP